ncbi:TPA: DUF4232 domain-containing protein [Serratia marcescens]|uniref:DUF4232 domain-containing protein n=1 Tax=Serratia TaxID=613 RepID=UPI0006997E0D|nr:MULTISPECIES: DUF4232 domain-containing protein [Serratia]MBH2927912.1 DUF4232 domain-containing protein [Serratia ureilytica]
MRYLSPILLTSLSWLLFSPVCADTVSILPCESSGITLNTDDRDGLYDGMSQSGMSLVLHNAGKRACMLPPLPALEFSDAKHRPVAAERRTVRGMHLGPALPPVIVSAGENLQILLRWVGSDAFEAGNCIRPAFVSLSLAGGTLTTPFNRTMCAAKAHMGYYSQSLTGTP